MSWVFITSKKNAKTAKECFEDKGHYDKERKVTRLSEEEVMIPIKRELAEQIKHEQTKGNNTLLFSLEGRIQFLLQDVGHRKVTPQEKLKLSIEKLLQKKDVTLDECLYKDLPSHWEQHGDLILLPEKSFTLDKWKDFGVELWQVVAEALGAARLAKKSTISSDGFRTPKVNLLLGDNGWVTHIDNGIKYTFDVTKCMFSAGNITEKIRVGNFECKGQTVVDLYAGIGYFVLPYLVHSKAAIVYACEWNNNAIEALRRNLKLNNVDKRCVIYEGDNQKFPLRGVADHVNLGLIPSSESGWPVACAALRSDTGGWLHVHGNVTSGLTNNELGSATPTQTSSFPTEADKPKLKCHQPLVDGKVCNTGQTSSSSATVLSNMTSSDVKCMANDEIDNLYCSNALSTESQELEGSLFSMQSPLVYSGYAHSPCNLNQMPSCNKKVKLEWLDWAKYVAQTLLEHLKKSHDVDSWDVQIQHIEHVKSYAPHIDHIVLDVKCCPLYGCLK